MSDNRNDPPNKGDASANAAGQPTTHAHLGPNVTPLLTTALRRARLEEAEHADVITDLREAEIARLDMLKDALRPLLAQVPAHIDLFDIGVMPSEHPRLFIDMIGFVEMARDRRSYRFVQDTRHGRITIAENELIEPMCEAIANYMARRLIERERALISDQSVEDAARRLINATPQMAPLVDAPQSPAPSATATSPAPVAHVRRHWILSLFGFLITLLGTFLVLALLALGAWVA